MLKRCVLWTVYIYSVSQDVSYKLDIRNKILKEGYSCSQSYCKRRYGKIHYDIGGRNLNLRDYLMEHEADRCTRPRREEWDEEKGEYDDEND